MAKNGSDGSLVFDTELDNEGFEKGSDKLLSSIDGLIKQVNTLGTDMKDAFSGVTSTLQTLSSVIQQSYGGMGTGATQAAQAAQQVGQSQNQAAAATNRAAKAASSYDKELARLQKQITNARNKLADYYQEIENIKAATDEQLRQTTSDEQAANVLEIEQMQLDAVNQKYAAKIAILEDLEAEYARVSAARDAATQPPPDTGAGGQSSSSDVGDMSQTEQEATQSTERLRGSFLGLRAAMNAVGNAAINAGKCLARLGFRAIASGVKKAVSTLKSFTAQARKTTLTSNGLVKSLTSVKRLLITRVKRMFISAIFNSVKEGIQRLAQFSSEFNATMSEMKNSATQLSGNIAVSIGNIISAIEPVISRIIALLSQAISYLNQFFALLNGKQTYTRAKKGAQSYADAASAAGGAQKEWNAELYGYDELTRQSDQSGGGSGTDTGIEYEEVPIDLPQGVVDWIERLKETWKNGDWYGVGQVLAEGLNTALGVADDWINNTLRPKGVEWAGRIATILNGLTDGVDWPLLGKTVADGLNAIADIYNTFMYTYDWENLGTRLAQSINGFVYNVEWDNIGRAFAAGWRALVLFIHGLVYETDWAALGTGIGTAIYSWFTSIDWVKLADSIVTGFNGLVTALRNAIRAVNWGEVGTILADSLETLITGINWAELGGLLSDAVLALLRLCLNLLTDIDWYAVGDSIMQGIIDMIVNIDWLQVLATLGSCIISLVGGAVELLLGMIGGLTQQIADAFTLVGEDSIAGFFQGISDAMRSAATWIKEHIVDPVVNAVKDFFGIHSPSTVFAEIGSNLIQGLFDGISKVWHIITDFFSETLPNLEEELSTTWENVKTAAVNAWTETKTNVVNAFTETKNTIINTANTIRSGLSTTWESVKTTARNAWNSVKNTAISSFSSLKTSVMDKWNGLKTSMKSVEWGSIGTNLVNGLKNGISNAWSGLMTKVQSLVTSLTNKVKSLFGVASPSKVFAEIGGFLDEGLAQGLENGKRGLLTTAANIANAVTNGMTPDTPQVDMTADSVISGMQAVISNLGGIAATFKTIADALTAIGGFTMPQIAAGTVVPYRTRVDTYAPPTGDSDGVTGYLMGILSELQALAEALRSGGSGQSSEIKLIINGREVFQTVVDENERAIQRTGKSPIRV